MGPLSDPGGLYTDPTFEKKTGSGSCYNLWEKNRIRKKKNRTWIRPSKKNPDLYPTWFLPNKIDLLLVSFDLIFNIIDIITINCHICQQILQEKFDLRWIINLDVPTGSGSDQNTRTRIRNPCSNRGRLTLVLRIRFPSRCQDPCYHLIYSTLPRIRVPDTACNGR